MSTLGCLFFVAVLIQQTILSRLTGHSQYIQMPYLYVAEFAYSVFFCVCGKKKKPKPTKKPKGCSWTFAQGHNTTKESLETKKFSKLF